MTTLDTERVSFLLRRKAQAILAEFYPEGYSAHDGLFFSAPQESIRLLPLLPSEGSGLDVLWADLVTNSDLAMIFRNLGELKEGLSFCRDMITQRRAVLAGAQENGFEGTLEFERNTDKVVGLSTTAAGVIARILQGAPLALEHLVTDGLSGTRTYCGELSLTDIKAKFETTSPCQRCLEVLEAVRSPDNTLRSF